MLDILVLILNSIISFDFVFRFKMVKIARKDNRGCKHSSGSYKRKSGPKAARKGKQMKAKHSHLVKAAEKSSWKRKIPHLIASLALARGESMDGGEARMALYITLKVIEEAQDLQFDVAGEKVQGLHVCFQRAAELTGSNVPTLKQLFWSLYDSDGATYNITDTSNRGRGSDSVGNASLYKVKPEQAAAIRDFIQFANSSQGAAKVSSSPTPPCIWLSLNLPIFASHLI